MNAHTFIKPDWATSCDRTVDVSDIWMEQVDPENEEGAIVTACLSAEIEHFGSHDHNSFYGYRFTVLGVIVETRGLTEYRDRKWLIRAFGWDCVSQIEEPEMEAAGALTRPDQFPGYVEDWTR